MASFPRECIREAAQPVVRTHAESVMPISSKRIRFFRIEDLLDRYSYSSIRLYCYAGRYRPSQFPFLTL